MAGAVGGFTSTLSLDVKPEGFTQGINLLKDLRSQLEGIKKIAGSLGTLKLTIKIEGQEDAIKERKKQLTPQQSKILDEYKMEKHTIGDKKRDEDEQRKQLKKLIGSGNEDESLGGLSSALKFAVAAVFLFKATLDAFKIPLEHISTNSQTALSAAGFDMSAKAFYNLQNIGDVYAPKDRKAFDQALTKLQDFQTNPKLYGDLEHKLAVGLSTGAGVNISSKFLGSDYKTNLVTIADALMAKMNSKNDDERRKALDFSKSFFGDSATNALININKSAGEDKKQGTLEWAEANINNMNVQVDFEASRKAMIEFQKTNEIFQNQLDSLASDMAKWLTDPMKKINETLIKNKAGMKSALDHMFSPFFLAFNLWTGNVADNKAILDTLNQDDLEVDRVKARDKDQGGIGANMEEFVTSAGMTDKQILNIPGALKPKFMEDTAKMEEVFSKLDKNSSSDLKKILNETRTANGQFDFDKAMHLFTDTRNLLNNHINPSTVPTEEQWKTGNFGKQNSTPKVDVKVYNYFDSAGNLKQTRADVDDATARQAAGNYVW